MTKVVVMNIEQNVHQRVMEVEAIVKIGSLEERIKLECETDKSLDLNLSRDLKVKLKESIFTKDSRVVILLWDTSLETFLAENKGVWPNTEVICLHLGTLLSKLLNVKTLSEIKNVLGVKDTDTLTSIMEIYKHLKDVTYTLQYTIARQKLHYLTTTGSNLRVLQKEFLEQFDLLLLHDYIRSTVTEYAAAENVYLHDKREVEGIIRGYAGSDEVERYPNSLLNTKYKQIAEGVK